MMFRGSLFARLLAVIVFVAILAAAGTMIFRAGQAEGYAMGASAAAAQGDQSQLQPPPVPYAYPGFYYGYRPFFPMFAPFGFLFFIGWIFFLFFVVGGLFRFLGWGRFGPGRGPWRHEYDQNQPADEQQPQQPAE